jgi:cytoskeletal protein CcmA (bactofilin family)
MWKRDEAVKPTSGQSTPTGQTVQSQGSSSGSPQAREFSHQGTGAYIGKSLVIKGELNASEDLTIDGKVEGKIELKEHVLTIGPNGNVTAHVFAKVLVVLGEVNGNITASEKVEIRDGGSLEGDVASPRMAIAEGAHFRGSVDMQRKSGQPGQTSQQQQRAAAKAEPQSQAAAQVAQRAGR